METHPYTTGTIYVSPTASESRETLTDLLGILEESLIKASLAFDTLESHLASVLEPCPTEDVKDADAATPVEASLLTRARILIAWANTLRGRIETLTGRVVV